MLATSLVAAAVRVPPSCTAATQRDCEITTVSQCQPTKQKNAWFECAKAHSKDYTWKMVFGRDITLPEGCNSKKSNTRFVDCKPDEDMPHVKWEVNNGVQTCIHFDNACKKKISKKQLARALAPTTWRTKIGRKNPTVFRFIKFSQ